VPLPRPRRQALVLLLVSGLLGLALAHRCAALSAQWNGWAARRAAWELLHGELGQQQPLGG